MHPLGALQNDGTRLILKKPRDGVPGQTHHQRHFFNGVCLFAVHCCVMQRDAVAAQFAPRRLRRRGAGSGGSSGAVSCS